MSIRRPGTSIVFVLAIALDFVLSPGRAPAAVRIDAIDPTVFFIERDGALLQRVDLTITNDAGPLAAEVQVSLGSADHRTVLDKVDKGTDTYAVYIPDITEPTPATFVLTADGKSQDERSLAWQPQRQWEVFLTPMSHHDLGYTQSAEEIWNKYMDIYDEVLRLCDETADWPDGSQFKYTVEQAWSIQRYVKERPKEVVDHLVQYIREGRIEITGLYGNEVSGMTSHEELVRLMYPSFRFKRDFGAPIQMAFTDDVPGLSWGLPTVLADAGVKYFFAGLPTYFEWGEWGKKKITTFWNESAVLRHGRPDAFRWEGPDGQSVLVYYQGGYGCWNCGSYDRAQVELAKMLREMQDNGSPFSVARYGCAGCSDNTPPALYPSEIARQWNQQWAYPKYRVATMTEFFEALEPQCKDLRTFRGEIPHTDYAVGATSSDAATIANRRARDNLNAAEKLNTLWRLFVGTAADNEMINSAYDSLMLYDEHTWGMARPAGEIQDWCWSDKAHQAYRAAGYARGILMASTYWLTKQIGFDDAAYRLVVYNALSIPRTDVVRVTAFTLTPPFDLVDEVTNESVPYQIVKLDSPQAPIPYASDRYALGQDPRSPQELIDLVFVAKDVPALGYKSYRLVPRDTPQAFPNNIDVGVDTLENRFFKVTLDATTGTIASIYDKTLSRELVDDRAPHKLNQFITRWVQTGAYESPTTATIRIQETGPVFAGLRVTTQMDGCPHITQDIMLYDELPRIDIANRILKDSTPLVECYFAFPFKMQPPDFRFEASDSVIKPFRDQFPGSNTNYYSVQHWADVSDGQMGITLTPVDSHLLEFGGLWPSYVSQAHHAVDVPEFGHRGYVRPDEVTQGYMYAYVLNNNFRTNFRASQIGDLLFRYSITTHHGDWKAGHPRDFGWAVCNPLVPAEASYKQKGPLPKTASFCQIDKANVFLSTMKQAEDGKGIILRLIETDGDAATATVTLPHLTISKAYRTNLVEENREALPAQPHQIEVPVKAFGISTVRLEVEPTE